MPPKRALLAVAAPPPEPVPPPPVEQTEPEPEPEFGSQLVVNLEKKENQGKMRLIVALRDENKSYHLSGVDKRIDTSTEQLNEGGGAWALIKIEFPQTKSMKSANHLSKTVRGHTFLDETIGDYIFNISSYPVEIPIDDVARDISILFGFRDVKLTFEYIFLSSLSDDRNTSIFLEKARKLVDASKREAIEDPQTEPEPEPEADLVTVHQNMDELITSLKGKYGELSPEPEPFSETGGKSSDIIRVILYRNPNFHGIELEDSEGLVKIKNVTASEGEDYATFDHYNNVGLKPGQIITQIASAVDGILRQPAVVYTVADAKHARDLLKSLLRDINVELTLKKGSSEPEADLVTVHQNMDELITYLKGKYGEPPPEAIVVPPPPYANHMQPSAPAFVDDIIISMVAPTHGPEYAGKIMDFFLRANDGLGFNPYTKIDVDALLIRIEMKQEDDLLNELGLDKEHILNLIPKIYEFSAGLKHKKRKKTRKRKKSRKKKTRERKKSKKKKTRKRNKSKNRKTRKNKKN